MRGAGKSVGRPSPCLEERRASRPTYSSRKETRSYFRFAFFFAFFFTTFFFAFFFAAMLHLPCSLGDTIGQRPQRPNPLPGYKAPMRFSIENQNSIRQRVPIDALGARPAARSRIRSMLFGDKVRNVCDVV